MTKKKKHTQNGANDDTVSCFKESQGKKTRTGIGRCEGRNELSEIKIFYRVLNQHDIARVVKKYDAEILLLVGWVVKNITERVIIMFKSGMTAVLVVSSLCSRKGKNIRKKKSLEMSIKVIVATANKREESNGKRTTTQL